MDDLVRLIWRMLSDAGTAWSIGGPGVGAEFHHLRRQPPPRVHRTPFGGRVVTRLGALSVDLPSEVHVIAYERPVEGSLSWMQAACFCLPVTRAGMRAGAALTEIGPDADALRPWDADATLFDLGFGGAHLDICVRTGDPSLVSIFRAAAGETVAMADHPAIRAIMSPRLHRVCRSRLARIESYQHGVAGRGRQPSSRGPHVRLASAADPAEAPHPPPPVPTGWVPALTVYPGHPLTEADGAALVFDRIRHAAFQRLLSRYAVHGYLEEKALVAAAVHAGLPPARYPRPETEAARCAVRVALRQLRCLKNDPATIDAWLAVFDPRASSDRPGH